MKGDYMKDFFTFYENIKSLPQPFVVFSISHLIALVISGCVIWYLFHTYKKSSDQKKEIFLKGIACFFILEEIIYAIWLLINCHDQILLQILPLELCSVVVYVNIISIFIKKDCFRFFSAVIGLFAGSIAMLYPVNISEIYPVISYRVINFYLMHGAFVLYALILLRDRSLLAYKHLKKNTLFLCILFTIAFVVNYYMHSQYMFIGAPPKFAFALIVFRHTGFVLFLPSILIIVSLLQTLFLCILRRVYGVSKMSK